MIRFFSPLRPLLKGWLFCGLGFGLFAFFVVWQFSTTMALPLKLVGKVAVFEWLPWGFLTPLIFRFVSRLPIERERWLRALVGHVLCAVVILMSWNWLAAKLSPPLLVAGPPEAIAPMPGPGLAFPPRPPARIGMHPIGPPRRIGGFNLLLMRLPMYLTLLSIAHAVHFYQRSREREVRALELTASLAQARLEALKTQLQPHFLFNALNAIAALGHKDPQVAGEMLGALGELLRLSLRSSGEQELPLWRELDFVERYLAIERMRFGDRLRFTFEIDPETENALVPAFVLQPLVENAVRHGLQPKLGPGTLVVQARRANGTLQLEVRDDGVGLPSDTPPHEGIGLTNTRSRLRELYGAEGQLSLHRTEGTRVEVSLPFHIATA